MKKTILSLALSILCMFLSAQVSRDFNLYSTRINIHNDPFISEKILMVEISDKQDSLVFVSKQNEYEYWRNAVYFELFGPGILYSINYERRISPHFNFRAGFTSWSLGHNVLTLFLVEEFKFTAFPVMVNYITGPMKSHHFEIGAGVMPSFFSGKSFFSDEEAKNATYLIGISSLGYKYQRPDGGFFFRAALNPLLGEGNVQIFGGLSFGIVF